MRVKDSMTQQTVGGVKLPKLKGEVCIQLFNKYTGRLEKEVKGHNIVTNAIRDIFAENNLGLTDYSSLMPLSKKLFGGILCFQNALTENADNYYLPVSSVNPVIAHAGQTTYSSAGADNTRGLPNDTESGVITGGYKMVWDFPATQGNGVISALGLCPADLGDFAMNGGSSFYPFARLDMLYRQSGLGNRQRCPSLYNATTKAAYSFVISGSSVTIREFPNYGVITEIGINQSSLMDNSPLDYADHTFTITNANACYILMYQGNIHFLYASGSSITRTIINTSTWQTTSDSLTIQGANLQSPVGGTTGNFTDMDADGYVYFLGNNSKFYKVNYTNVADVVEISRQDTNAYIYKCGGFACFGKYTHIATGDSNAYIIEGNTAHPCAVSVARYPYTDSNYIVSSDGNGYGTGMMKNSLDLVRTIGWSNYQATFEINSGYANAMSKLFLSTVKNLDAPVTKSATQTMKISYSITEVAENEE